VLQCVSSSVELLGDQLRPHLATICSALPQASQQLGGCRCSPEGSGSRPCKVPDIQEFSQCLHSFIPQHAPPFGRSGK
jgi:hypothetical protein